MSPVLIHLAQSTWNPAILFPGWRDIGLIKEIRGGS